MVDSSSTIWAPVGEQGPVGPQGPIGPPGPQGPVGGPGPDAGTFNTFVADLLNNTDPAKGAAKVGSATRNLIDIAQLKTVVGLYNKDAVYVKDYYSTYPGKGGGVFIWDAASTLAEDGGTVFQVTGVPTGRWMRQYDMLLFSHFGFIPAVSSAAAIDRTAAYQKAIDYITAQLLPSALFAEAGSYKFSTSPNLAIQGARIYGLGRVFFENLGSGTTFLIDGQVTPNGNIYDLRIEGLSGAGSSVSGHGVTTKSLHASYIDIQIEGCGVTSDAYHAQFSVCTEFKLRATKNGRPLNQWYKGTNGIEARPLNGFFGTELNPGELLSYCTFINPILEHCAATGMKLDKAFGNGIFGGTMEGIGSVGLFLTANAFNNKFYNIDFEVNTDHDIYCIGRENFFINCDSEKQITLDSGSTNNMVQGGSHQTIFVGPATFGTKLHDLIYNRNATTGQILDNSGGKINYQSVTNRGTSDIQNAPRSFGTIAVGATPFTYVNTTWNEITVIVSGGTVTAIEYLRPGGFQNVGTLQGTFTLSPGDSLKVTYTGLPTMRSLPR